MAMSWSCKHGHVEIVQGRTGSPQPMRSPCKQKRERRLQSLGRAMSGRVSCSSNESDSLLRRHFRRRRHSREQFARSSLFWAARVRAGSRTSSIACQRLRNHRCTVTATRAAGARGELRQGHAMGRVLVLAVHKAPRLNHLKCLQAPTHALACATRAWRCRFSNGRAQRLATGRHAQHAAKVVP